MKKGFTLIELLAVIIILAIIAIIATPVITDLINRSRYGAFGVSKKNIERAAELYYSRYAASIIWDNDVSYIEIGTLKSKKYLSPNVVDVLTNMEISDDTKVLLHREGVRITYSLQLYNEIFFDWYQNEMIKAVKKDDVNLPSNIGDRTTIDLEELMNNDLVDELRLPLELGNRCVGYVEVEKLSNDDYDYNAYVDCLTNASTFASHYVSYGGKYIDSFNDVIETSDGGYIAVGESNSETITKYGNIGKGKYDAIIVKFKSDGTVEWSQNFGGTNNDYFYSVVETTDGYVAVGSATSSDGDLTGLYKGGDNDAIIVKYDKQGELTLKKTYGTSGTNGKESFNKILKTSDGYVLAGSVNVYVKDGDLTGATTNGSRANGMIIKMDNNFNTIWRSFFEGYYFEYILSMIKTSDNNYAVVGISSSFDYDMAGLGYDATYGDNDAIIMVYNSSGTLQYKNSFKGSATEYFKDVVEVSDGYIAVGYSQSSNGDMDGISKASNGYSDCIIVKFDKTLSNILWKKTYGGTYNEEFNKILGVNDNEVIAVGYSQSTDMDMSNILISSGGYSNSILVKFNAQNGNIITEKSFGGENSDHFNSIIKTSDDQYVVVGNTYSSNVNLKNFNKGHSDAILVLYDKNYNLVKGFEEPVILIEKLKTINPNYGTNISLSYPNIYTTNNPEVDLGGWCSTASYLPNNSNYPNGICLVPFNNDDIKRLTAIQVTQGLSVLQGEHEYPISNPMDDPTNWHRIYMYFGSSTGSIEISNLKIKFQDGYVGSIQSAIENGYINPLVVISNGITDRPEGYMPTLMNIKNDGGTAGVGSYPVLNILIKPKKSKLESVIFTSSKNSSNQDGMRIEELRNFDMSITPTN